jgi:hypothetical protein
MLSIIPAQESPVEQPEKVKQSAPKRPRGRPKLTTKQRRARDLATSENLTDQLLFAFRRGNRFFAFGGLLVGGFIPLGSYTLIHQEVAAKPYLWALVAGGLLYSSTSVFLWAVSYFHNKLKAIGFVILLEGILTLSSVEWLSITGLAILMSLNAVTAAMPPQAKNR